MAMSLTHWMDDNLRTQGYRLGEEEARTLALGLRFPTAVCLGLVVTGLVLESPLMLFALSAIGAVAGFASRHPFDHLWNRVVRHPFRAPPLPPNPPRRRHAFKIATVWLLGVATLFAAGATTAGLVLGGMLVAACAAVTIFNLCLPSVTFALIDRYRRRREPMPA
jgi:Domain of unknown function (DUF4395)